VSNIMLALPTWFLLASFMILGAIWGSFAGALCSRWPRDESVAKGRSCCDHCGRQIAAYDLVPILSYIVLNGKCRHCGEKIGTRPFATELIAALVGAASLLLLPPGQALAVAIFGWLLIPLVILDYSHLWLPNRLVLLLALAGLLAGSMVAPDTTLPDRLIGMFAGFLSLEAIRLVYKYYRQQDGMGAGDPKLFGALGLWLGWQALPITLLIASAIGIAAMLFARAVNPHPQSMFPFGSFLGVAGYLSVFVNAV
jgi:leader peptidase (prepilin peptidase)/N-methyltransferase